MAEVDGAGVEGGADADLPELGAAERPRPAGRGDLEERLSDLLAPREAQTGAGPQALVHLEQAGLLDQVDDRVAVASERQPDAVAQVFAGRDDAVAEVGLGGRAGTHVVAGERDEVGRLEVDRVHRREAARAVEAAGRAQ